MHTPLPRWPRHRRSLPARAGYRVSRSAGLLPRARRRARRNCLFKPGKRGLSWGYSRAGGAIGIGSRARRRGHAAPAAAYARGGARVFEVARR